MQQVPQIRILIDASSSSSLFICALDEEEKCGRRRWRNVYIDANKGATAIFSLIMGHFFKLKIDFFLISLEINLNWNWSTVHRMCPKSEMQRTEGGETFGWRKWTSVWRRNSWTHIRTNANDTIVATSPSFRILVIRKHTQTGTIKMPQMNHTYTK
jgi:hypothetical protein